MASIAREESNRVIPLYACRLTGSVFDFQHAPVLVADLVRRRQDLFDAGRGRPL